MELSLPKAFLLSTPVARALAMKLPVVALESTVITHGLPYPENQNLALDMEEQIRTQGATPATIAVIEGRVRIGVETAELERLAQDRSAHKISSRDYAPAIAMKWTGGTTVAATLLAAHTAGIQVFATGGIGGVHRGIGNFPSPDISADLPQLSRTQVVVVCAGAKAILDLPATLEYLETAGVPVVGYRTGEFPAFYSRSSGLQTSARADSAEEIAALARAHWSLEGTGAVLVVAPPPEEVALPAEKVQGAIEKALTEMHSQRITGQGVTPFLLAQVSELTGGASLQANLGLLRNNARIAAGIALELSKKHGYLVA